jgi:ornithine cyclodeaminase
VITATPAGTLVLDQPPREDAFVAAVGAFTPAMAEIDAGVVRWIAGRGRVVLDSASARHEAGDLLQAGLAMGSLPLLGDAVEPAAGPVLFKSCGSALWDLAAAHCLGAA